MTSKQLIKFAKSLGWVLARHGSNHQIFTHENSTQRVIIPYHTRDHVGTLIKKQLLAGVAWDTPSPWSWFLQDGK